MTLDETARLVQRVSVLLSAGVSPATAWSYLDGYEDLAADLPASLTRIDPALAAAWRVATSAGAPLAPSLQAFAVGLRALADAQRETEVALAGPVATARLVLALPVVGILFGMVLGFNTLGTLFTTVPGLLCLGVGVTLLLAARRWNRRLVAAAQPMEVFPGLQLELLAIAVTGEGRSTARGPRSRRRSPSSRCSRPAGPTRCSRSPHGPECLRQPCCAPKPTKRGGMPARPRRKPPPCSRCAS